MYFLYFAMFLIGLAWKSTCGAHGLSWALLDLLPQGAGLWPTLLSIWAWLLLFYSFLLSYSHPPTQTLCLDTPQALFSVLVAFFCPADGCVHTLCWAMISPRERWLNKAARVLTLRVHAFLMEGTHNMQQCIVCRVMAGGKCSEEVTEMGEGWHTGVRRTLGQHGGRLWGVLRLWKTTKSKSCHNLNCVPCREPVWSWDDSMLSVLKLREQVNVDGIY